MRLDELLERATDSVDARMAYTEPYEKDGVTVIAAARVSGGGGGGDGTDQNEGQQGEGAGLGLSARPTGVYVLKDGELRWQPAIDVNRLVTTVGVVVLGALVCVTRIIAVRARARQAR